MSRTAVTWVGHTYTEGAALELDDVREVGNGIVSRDSVDWERLRSAGKSIRVVCVNYAEQRRERRCGEADGAGEAN